MSSAGHGSTAHSEPRERSRNAKAQARHRAKRKAYIEQLETTVTKLQLAMGFSTEQVSVMPPPLLKIRELEQENARLQKENEELRRLLTDSSSRSLDTRRAPSYDLRGCDRDYGLKRRKPGHEGMYFSPGEAPAHPNESSRPPPPLTIPQPLSHHYNNGLSSSSGLHSSSHGSGSVLNLGGPPFQLPNTPSGSSATSSPPFSPIQMQPPSLDHRSHLSDHHSHISSYSHGSHYPSVKVEDDHYGSSSHSSHTSSLPSYAHTANGSTTASNIDWHPSYSATERGYGLHR